MESTHYAPLPTAGRVLVAFSWRVFGCARQPNTRQPHPAGALGGVHGPGSDLEFTHGILHGVRHLRHLLCCVCNRLGNGAVFF